MNAKKNAKKIFALPILSMLLLGFAGTTSPAFARPRVSVGIRVNAPPPPLRHEVVVVRPGPGHVWVGGFWEWRNHDYVWVPGRWARPPHRGAVWVAPRFEHRGRHHVWVRGFWR
jgi:hypothetical protein